MAVKKKVEVQPESDAQEEQVVQPEQPAQEEQAVEAAPVEKAQEAEAVAEQPEQEVAAEAVIEQPAQEVATETVAQPAQQEVAVASSAAVAEKETFGAKIKEWFRKKVVGLKRSPQSITLLALFITTALWLIWLFTFSRTIAKNSVVEWCGLAVFVNTLISILILALFGNAFPKRKKPNVVFIVMLFVFMAIIIACDVIYYVQMKNYLYGASNYEESHFASAPYMLESLTLAIVHIVLIAICAVLLATLPLYKRLINMINTKKVVATNEIKETIDVEED